MSERRIIDFDTYLTPHDFFNYSAIKRIIPQISKTSMHTNHETLDANSISDYLVAFSTHSQNYCVGYVDMVNSTKISASISSYKLSEYFEIFLNSMSKIIGQFGGKVIKNIGDSLFYYFPYSDDLSLNGSIFRCLDCGLAMLNSKKLISQELSYKKLPPLYYRISADFGSVLVMHTTESSFIDLIGPPVNMCAKINRCADKHEFVIGNDLHERIKKSNAYRFKQIQGCNIGFRQSYPVYKVFEEYLY